MYLLKTLVLAALLVAVHSRYVSEKDFHPRYFLEDRGNILEDDMEDALSEQLYESVHPGFLKRQARQVHGVASTNPDGSTNLNAKIPLAGNDQNVLSALASGSGLKNGGGYSAAGAGLALDNVNGHGLSLTGTHIPNFGDQLTAAAKVNLLNTPDHNANVNAFVTKNMPNIPNLPNFNTKGANVDYTFKDKVGASFGIANTDLFKKTDYSAMGNLNLFRNPTSSLDLSAGFSKSVSPYIPRSSWEPSAGLTFRKYW